MMGSVHLINAERSVTSCITSSLLPHSVSHKECLIWFLSTKPIIKDIVKMILINALLTFHLFFRWVIDFAPL